MTWEAQSVQAWFDTEEGKSCADIVSLGGKEWNETYLRNRLWKAFVAGVEAGRQIQRDEMVEKFRKWMEQQP